MYNVMPVVASGGSGVIGTLLGEGVVQLMPLEVVILFSIVFVVLGFRRGVRAEIWSTMCILAALVILAVWGDTLIAHSNRVYKLARFALAGGLVSDNPVEIWQQLADQPPLIESETEKLLFRLAFFLAVYLIGLLLGRLTVKRTLVPVGFQLFRQVSDLSERLLGAIVGGVNGFLIALFVLPRVLPAEKETVIVIPKTSVVTEFMNENLANVAFAMIVIIIVLGLIASSGKWEFGVIRGIIGRKR